MRNQNNSHLKSEIHEQSITVERLINESLDELEPIVQQIKQYAPSRIVFASRGTSHNAALYGSFLLNIIMGLPTQHIDLSLYTTYEAQSNLANTLVIAVSQSGSAKDINMVLQDAEQQGALTLAITNFQDSLLADNADMHLWLKAEDELSVAATKTYTAQQVIMAMLVAYLAENTELIDDLQYLPQAVKETIAMTDENEGWAQRYRYSNRFVVLGHGYNNHSAREISLKLTELTYIPSVAYDIDDFQHGPKAMIDQGFPAILVAPSGKATQQMSKMLTMLNDLNAETLVISDDVNLLSQATVQLPIPTLPEWLSPIVSVIPGQVFAMQQTIARGWDVDNPRYLNKVTHTE